MDIEAHRANPHISLEMRENYTAGLGRQFLIEPVSADSLPETGIFAETAADFWEFPPQVQQSECPGTKANARKAGISGPFPVLLGSPAERRNA
jgi:hypothetical protein